MIADPAPLGLAAFALTTFLLSLVNAGVMPKDTEPVMLGVALAFGGIAQLLAGMWEFRKGNVFGATVFIVIWRLLAVLLGLPDVLRRRHSG